jgi:flagellar biosynthesis/type III secretory pathway M-ring protein FliF/YscJ
MKFNFTLKNCVLLVIVLLFSYMLLCQFFPTKEGMKEGADHEESNEEGEAEEAEEAEEEEEEKEKEKEETTTEDDLKKLEELLEDK